MFVVVGTEDRGKMGSRRFALFSVSVMETDTVFLVTHTVCVMETDMVFLVTHTVCVM